MKTEFKSMAKCLLDMQDKIRYMTDKAEELAEELKAKCNHQDTTVDGYTYKSFNRKGNVVYADIPELEAVDLDLYRSEPVTMWKLTYQKQYDLD